MARQAGLEFVILNLVLYKLFVLILFIKSAIL